MSSQKYILIGDMTLVSVQLTVRNKGQLEAIFDQEITVSEPVVLLGGEGEASP